VGGNMRIRTLAWANLKRRKARAVFLIIGIAIGIATATALLTLSGMIKEEIGLQLDQFGANIIVVPRSNNLQLDYGGIPVSGVSFDTTQLKNEDVEKLREIPYRNRLSVVAPKILGAAEIEGRQVLLAGINFESELRLKRWWRLVGEKPRTESDLLLGFEAAKALSVIEQGAHDLSVPVTGTPDVTVSETSSHHNHMAGEGRHFRIVKEKLRIADREYRVAGVITQTGGREDAFVMGALPEVQSLLNRPGQLSLIEVSALCKDCPVEDIVGQIAAKLPNAKVSSLQQSVSARAEAVERLTRFASAVSLVVLLIGGLMIFTTMMGAVVERTKEIGVLRAIGFRRSHIIKGLMLEVIVLSGIGGLLGWAAGALSAWALLPYFSQTGLPFEVNPAVGAVAVLAALMIGAVSSIYPTLRASRLDPTEAVRYV
jgi:putative ABC transport system permease protein